MNNEFEYYVIEPKKDKAYPLLKTNGDAPHTMEYIKKKAFIKNPQIAEFTFSKPYPRKAIVGDYLEQPECVVSQKIADILTSMKISGIQLIPAIVTSNKGDLYENFYYINIFHLIEAMDKNKDKSKYELNEYGIYWIDRFSLDKEVLKKIPLDERLVFKLKEHFSIKLFHRSVVDAIMATEPEGVQFTKEEEWSF